MIFRPLCLAGAFLALSLQSSAQLATRINGTLNYGHLFTDGTTLYALRNDSVSTVNTQTGTLSFATRLPTVTGGSWDNTHIVKTPTGFMLPRYYRTGATLNATKIWAFNGSAWDTVLTDYQATTVTGPLRIGTRFAFLFTNTGTFKTEIGRTDGTLTNSAKVYSGGIVTLANTFSGTLVFSGTSGSSIPSSYPKKVFALSDASLSYVDSASGLCTPLGIVGNEIVYHYLHQSGTPGTPNLVTTNRLMKHNLTTHTNTVLSASLPSGTAYTDGTVYQAKIIAQKIDSGRGTPNLVAINPGSGAETYLTTNPARSTGAQYFTQFQGAGSAHLYVYQTDTNSAQVTFITDGTTMSSGRMYRSPRVAIQFKAPNTFDPAKTIVCGDEVYGGMYRGNGTYQQELFRVNALGQVDSQIIKPSTPGGSEPQNFVQVNGELFFRTLDTFTYDAAFNRIDQFNLWKVTACSNPTAVTQVNTQETGSYMYPNPASTTLSVALQPGVSEARLQVYDATGRQVLDQLVSPTVSIPVTALPAGLYLYRISTQSQSLGMGRLLIGR